MMSLGWQFPNFCLRRSGLSLRCSNFSKLVDALDMNSVRNTIHDDQEWSALTTLLHAIEDVKCQRKLELEENVSEFVDVKVCYFHTSL